MPLIPQSLRTHRVQEDAVKSASASLLWGRALSSPAPSPLPLPPTSPPGRLVCAVITGSIKEE